MNWDKWVNEKIEALYEKAEMEDAVPWNDAEPTPRKLAETLSDILDERQDLEVSCVSWEPPSGATFMVRYDSGTTLRVSVSVAEPSPRFYPYEGKPDEREKKDFEEAFGE